MKIIMRTFNHRKVMIIIKRIKIRIILIRMMIKSRRRKKKAACL